ncbi:cartilage matrix protein-like [Porites lutea]|uniref:cartilage matrix protein-like n=1 Tax=Porites lutea TaxID=51062 RepID=UPI003CC6BEB1
MDDSTSEGIDGFHSIKEFVIGLIRDMEVGPDKTSVCLILVHLNPTEEFNFKNHSSKLELEMAVSELIYSKGATGIKDSLKKAAAELFNPQAGARPEATKFLIVFSDGDFIPFSLDDWIHGINVLAVGSGRTIYEDSLKKLVKQPIKDFFTTNENRPKNVTARIRELSERKCV